jgi:hypothetical protein
MRHRRNRLLLPSLVAVVLSVQGGAHATAPDREESARLFKRIAEVLRHPRCMNCHPVTDFPRQGDARRRHQQMVVRGPANTGSPVMQCSNCHQEMNSPDGRVPGAPHWHLAPLSMGWEDLKTDKALCEVFVDRARNGDRDTEKILQHLTGDPLVQWAWAPGARNPPSIGQQEFHDLARRWVRTGAACPDD